MSSRLAVTAAVLVLVGACLVGPAQCFKARLMNTTYPTIQSLGISKKLTDSYPYTQDEERLLKYLFKDYNPNIIPKESLNESLKLYFGLAMSQLINIYDKEQVMKTNVWIHMYWVDPFLRWDHITEYKHITAIRVPFHKVWTPDIILFNNAHGKYDVSYKCKIVLYQQGSILWIPPAIYKSSCQINVQYFPFDQQTCEMIFGSWVYSSDDLTLDYFENMRHVDLNDYVPSGTWDLIDVPASIEYYNDTATNRTKAQMVYRIRMRRKSLFYVVNLIIPTFLISILSVCVFYLPTDDGEKITLSLSILFALVVFFLLIAKIIPPTSIVVPLISEYLLFTFIMNILSVFNTCIVISFYYKRSDLAQVHPWIKFIFINVLAPMIFLKRIKRARSGSAYDLTMQEAYRDYEREQAAREELPMTYYPGSPLAGLPVRPAKKPTMVNVDRNQVATTSIMKRPPNLALTKSSTLNRLGGASGAPRDPDVYVYSDRLYSSNYDLNYRSLGSSSGLSTYDIAMTSDGRKTVSRLVPSDYEVFQHHPNNRHRHHHHHHHEHKAQTLDDRYTAAHDFYKFKKTLTFTDDPQQGLKLRAAGRGDKEHAHRSANDVRLDERERAVRKSPSEKFLRTCKSIEYISNIMKTEAKLEEIKEDWKYIAAVLDRLMLIIFFVVTIVGTYFTLMNAPHLFEESDEAKLIKSKSLPKMHR